MINDLARKVTEVLDLLTRQNFVSAGAGLQIDGSSRKTVTHLLNEYRRRRRIGGQIYTSNLATYLGHPEEAPLRFLAELTEAIGLAELGFDETIWEKDLDTILQAVSTAVAGGALITVLRNKPWARLFELHPRRAMGFALDEAETPLGLYADLPEFTVVAGDHIAAKANMKFPGLLRVCASFEGVVVGLNAFLNIPAGALPHGPREFGYGATSPGVARTIVYAFACDEADKAIFDDWPLDHLKSNRLTQGEFLHRICRFFELPSDKRASNVQSFLTTATRASDAS